MAKIVLPTISGGYASVTQLNTAFDQLETELQSKVLYRDNPTGEPNQLENDLDMNGHRLLNQLATNGNENFAWMGTWVTGTVYAVNNLVYAPEGSDEGATLICITAHTAGATLDGDSAKWAVLAARGASGAGTGDVVGPASSTADSLARFNGVTGKLLKDGAVIGTDVQAQSAKLQSYHDNTLTAANKIPYATALGTASELDFLDEDTMVSNSATAVPSQQSVKAYVDSLVSPLTSGTVQNSTTGSSINFTSIPTWVQKLTLAYSGVSTNGTANIFVQIGDAGGLETTGYTGTVWDTTGAEAVSTGFNITRGGSAAAQVHNGFVTLVLIDPVSNTWCINGGNSRSDAAIGYAVSGTKSLSATLDRISLVTANTFDAGKVNILYE